jgi:crotonobetainyl-CoA:carnitine CoA-transferase CaiB-like acyl-CoA transferase
LPGAGARVVGRARDGRRACGPINDLGQTFADPQVRHRRMQVTAPHPAAGEVTMVANPIKFSETPIPTTGRRRSGRAHRRRCSGVLGLDSGAISRLKERGAI